MHAHLQRQVRSHRRSCTLCPRAPAILPCTTSGMSNPSAILALAAHIDNSTSCSPAGTQPGSRPQKESGGDWCRLVRPVLTIKHGHYSEYSTGTMTLLGMQHRQYTDVFCWPDNSSTPHCQDEGSFAWVVQGRTWRCLAAGHPRLFCGHS